MCDLENVETDNEIYAIMVKDGKTALSHAAIEGNGSVVRLLLDMGADVCVENKVCVSKYCCVIWSITDAASADFVSMFVNIMCTFMEIGVLAYIKPRLKSMRRVLHMQEKSNKLITCSIVA